MKRYILIALLLSGCCSNVFSQLSPAQMDSLKIDSLKKVLPSLAGVNRISCMIRLCGYYSDGAPIAGTNPNDSLKYYGTKVLNESRSMNYKRGIALGLLASGSDSFSIQGKKAREAIAIGEDIKSDETLGWCYTVLSSGNITPDAHQVEGYLQQAVDHFHRAGEFVREAAQSNWLSQSYLASGDYEKAFDCEKRSLDLLKRAMPTEFSYAHSQALLWAYWGISQLYSGVGDNESALSYMQMANEIDKGGFLLDISGIYFQMAKYDSAMFYLDRLHREVDTTHWWSPGRMLGYNYLADLYIATKQYDQGIELLTNNIRYFDSLLKYCPPGNWKHAGWYGKMGASHSLAKAYYETKQYAAALPLARESVELTKVENRRPEMMGGYQLLSSIYHSLGNNDSAYEYLLRYYRIRDSIQNKQLLIRLYNAKKDAETEKKQAQLLLLDRDNKLKGQQLQSEALQKNILLIILLALLLTGTFIYRSIYLRRKNERLRLENELTVQRLESERKQAELKRQASDLQMQALRAQMNPHFIFNSLSSINWFIMENDKDTASDYLTRFSRLMRMVLNAQKPTIPLDDELKMLQLYLDMERLRLENSFDYSITFTNAIDAGNVSIPPMLLQPFCENAIWHGFKNKEGQGHININIRTEDHLLECMITDDGIGRKQAALFKKKSSKNDGSMGLGITRERLALFSEENNAEADFEIEDLVDEIGNGTGTRVILKIVYKEFIEELI